MELTAADAGEIAEALPLALDLEHYRERLTPVALAVLQGESRRTIDKHRDAVLPDVWDGPMRAAIQKGIARLRAELERRLTVLDLAQADVDQGSRSGKLARLVVDRVLAELLDKNDKNIASLEELERELEASPLDERTARAAVVARGALLGARIPIRPNELRAATIRAARITERHGFGSEEAFDRGLGAVAETLATDERRAAVRGWVRALGEASAANAPLLSEALLTLASAAPLPPPANDPIWLQACLGLTLESAMAHS